MGSLVHLLALPDQSSPNSAPATRRKSRVSSPVRTGRCPERITKRLIFLVTSVLRVYTKLLPSREEVVALLPGIILPSPQHAGRANGRHVAQNPSLPCKSSKGIFMDVAMLKPMTLALA